MGLEANEYLVQLGEGLGMFVQVAESAADTSEIEARREAGPQAQEFADAVISQSGNRHGAKQYRPRKLKSVDRDGGSGRRHELITLADGFEEDSRIQVKYAAALAGNPTGANGILIATVSKNDEGFLALEFPKKPEQKEDPEVLVIDGSMFVEDGGGLDLDAVGSALRPAEGTYDFYSNELNGLAVVSALLEATQWAPPELPEGTGQQAA